MSNQERASLGLGDEEQIDLEQLTGAGHRPRPTPKQQQAILKAGEAAGFVSRQPARRRRRSPYTAQFGGKCREGMKAIFQEIAERLGVYDTQALEMAILALIEREGYDDLKEKFTKIVK